jgi:hypothetical protein
MKVLFADTSFYVAIFSPQAPGQGGAPGTESLPDTGGR